MRAPWRLVLDPPASGARNMAVDEALLLHVRSRGPALRLYTWSEPTVSLGFRQREPEWLDRCRRAGVEVVRRPSGGGAVLHGGDLTYAVVVPVGAPDVPEGLERSYRWIRAILLDGLARAGLRVGPAAGDPGARKLAVCFSGSLGLEIECEGRKLVGSAQRRTPFGLLQHGSIRLKEPAGLARAVFGALRPPPPATPPGCDVARLRRCLVLAFRDAVGGRLVPVGLGPEEKSVADSHEQLRRREPLWSPRIPQEGTSAAPILKHSTAMTPLRAEATGALGPTRKSPGVLGQQT